ncbi:hypothetical protein JZ751_006635 [Albula glossodonta]|uniref:Uncharacterized protein n=1 Tax=Albula glossodonta TaxID=121402 RepID=A0A8T2P1L7_9TELE|nr:hypothetical protein JZ751_006635 [Albula glossodonta]
MGVRRGNEKTVGTTESSLCASPLIFVQLSAEICTVDQPQTFAVCPLLSGVAGEFTGREEVKLESRVPGKDIPAKLVKTLVRQS